MASANSTTGAGTISLPPVQTLTNSTPEARAAVLDLLFEPSPALHSLASDASPVLGKAAYPTYSALIAAVEAHLNGLLHSKLDSDQQALDSILSSHPRLGEKKNSTQPQALSELSRREQEAMRAAEGTGAATAAASSEVEERLRVLNDEYEAKFSGLKYVTFVNGRPRPVIIKDIEARIKRGDLSQEKHDAIKAMCDIALDRAKKLGAE